MIFNSVIMTDGHMLFQLQGKSMQKKPPLCLSNGKRRFIVEQVAEVNVFNFMLT
jgi:hypothetical protein